MIFFLSLRALEVWKDQALALESLQWQTCAMEGWKSRHHISVPKGRNMGLGTLRAGAAFTGAGGIWGRGGGEPAEHRLPKGDK